MTSLRAQFTRELTIRGRAARTIQGYRPPQQSKGRLCLVRLSRDRQLTFGLHRGLMPWVIMASRVVFFAPPNLTPLDLIGPLQAFQAAVRICRYPYRIEVCALTRSLPVAGNLHFSNLVLYRQIELGPDDILFVAGCALT